MKSARISFFSCLLSGIILFIIGTVLVFNTNTRPSPQQKHDTALPSNNFKNSVDVTETHTNSGDPINFLVLIKEASGANTDSMIVANYEPVTNQISLLTIPRDIKPTGKGTYKINSVFYLGTKKYANLSPSERKYKATEYTAQTISNLTNIPIDYYVYLEIDTIKEIVDMLGGVYFDVPADLRYFDPSQDLNINLKKGYQLLDGDKAEQLLRFRKTPYNINKASSDIRKYYDGSDLKRTEMQIRFVNELIKQKATILNLPKLIPVINYTFSNVITNISLSDTLNLVSGFTKASRPEMNTFQLCGVDRTINDIYYFIYNNKAEDLKTNAQYDTQDIIDKYFQAKTGLFSPDPDKKYNFRSVLAENPSNSETETRSNGKDKP
ncbi:LCP family protein [Ruminiclostridium cellulolyticum]|uniref:Cell envelope-related transcriptional attenuator n=1 Tax=Ruminiclostridium cellulolyticum (strain ATCC 35319 / DSM 5812 / JCM 6584 / H10) TaxID=394503 RepID=B8I2S5_RUMCH|nr:LCP family protein [Ruminiclostridium cellulolyticum]ACL76068.1 cell envelope-related transcriptional attenuator [Ruminiclostridium cellulolyticum H10]